jgi:DNA-binding CsgD family transcriptional regulator
MGNETESLAALQLTKKLLTNLVSSANPDDFCRSLVHNVFKDQNAIAAFICRAEGDGMLQMMGSYGYAPERVRKDAKVSLFEPMGITDSIRESRIIVFNGWEDYLELYPDKDSLAGPGKAFVAVPFSREGFPAGGVGIAFNSYVNESIFNQLLWETIQLIGEVYVSPAWFNSGDGSSGSRTDESKATRKVSPENLPERAKKVLALMAEGKTNWQIASILRFSESTIKGDAALIYRAFGVNSREAAVAASPGTKAEQRSPNQ